MLLPFVFAAVFCVGSVVPLPGLALPELYIRPGYVDDLAKREPLSTSAELLRAALDQSVLGQAISSELELEHIIHPHKYHGDPHEDFKKKTIFQALGSDPKYSKVFNAVNLTDDVTKLLNDSAANVTFFAPPNWALPSRHPHDACGSARSKVNCELLEAVDVLVGIDAVHCGSDEELKKIIRAALLYHILPGPMTLGDLSKNTTWATNLTIGDSSLDDEPQRIRTSFTSRIAPILSVNVYAKVVAADIGTLNGIVHEINHPLFPPPTIFESLFLLQDIFSTVTSVLGRLGMTDQIDYRHHGEFEGSPTVTFFAPTNHAFQELPKKLKLYLFSKYGEKVLQKLLEYHILPGVILHSDWVHNVSAPSDDLSSNTPEDGEDGARYILPQTPIFHRNITADTLLEGHTVQFHVVQYERKLPLHPSVYPTEILVNGRPVRGADIIARNGAFHVIDQLLNPMKHHGHHDETWNKLSEDDWADWEEWLPRWANKAN